MQIKLTQDQYAYLEKTLPKEILDWSLADKNDQDFTVNLEDSQIVAVQDWASDQLQKEGFNEDYSANEAGQMLESLIDTFC